MDPNYVVLNVCLASKRDVGEGIIGVNIGLCWNTPGDQV